MVVVLANSTYTITELSDNTKVLTLGKQHFEWSKTPDGAAQLTRIRPLRTNRKPNYKGNYWLFRVHDKPNFTPGIHLCLVVRPGVWEAYLLGPVLPEKTGETCQVIATDECIACPRSRLHTTTNHGTAVTTVL